MSRKAAYILLRRRMKKEKTFLLKLYNEKSKSAGKKNSKTLEHATQEQIDVLFRILTCISHGHIPLKTGLDTELRASKRKLILEDLHQKLHKYRNSAAKKQLVKKFSSLYSVLLHFLFNRHKK